MSNYTVGKIGSNDISEFDTLDAAERKIEEFEKSDPDGVHSGDYFIDGPESDIPLFEDPNKCADYIERHQLNEGRELNPFVVEILGNNFAPAHTKDCWDRGHEYFEITFEEGQRVLKGNVDDRRRLTVFVNSN